MAVFLGKTLPLVEWVNRECETLAGWLDRCFIPSLVTYNGTLAIHPKLGRFDTAFLNTGVNQTTISRKSSEARSKVINQSFVAVPVNHRRRCRWGGGAVVLTIGRALSNSATTKAEVSFTKTPKSDNYKEKFPIKWLKDLGQ